MKWKLRKRLYYARRRRKQAAIIFRQHREDNPLLKTVLKEKKNAFVAACQQRNIIGSLSFKTVVIPLGR